MDETSRMTSIVPARRDDRSIASRLRISLISGGRVQTGDLVMMLLLFLPGFLVLIALGTYPIISVLSLAFQQRSLFDMTGTYVGLENFNTILSSPQFWEALKNTLVFTFTTVPLQLVLGLLIALLLHQKFPARNIFRGFMLFSYVVPVTVAAVIWKFMLSDSVGILYHAIRTTGLPFPNTWFSTSATAMPTVVMVTVWKFFPFMVINFLAGLQTIDEQLYEAAKVDGASAWQSFRHITLPQLMPVIVIVLLLRTIWTFNNWDIIALLTNGGPLRSTMTLPLQIYNTMFGEYSIGRAAALSFLVMLVLGAAMAVYLWFYRRTEENLR
ncbi:MAG: sugar ABC transporter permease [Anaerolineae bacterium]|nr:sugar ABC transporter permease [Anaerolineae bacterium]